MSNKKKKARRKQSFWTRERLIIIALVILSGFIVLGLLSYNSGNKVASNKPTVSHPTASTPTTQPLATEPAAPLTVLPRQVLGVELKAAKGSPFKLDDFSGKVLLVNFWASWCAPCRSETPALVELHKQLRSRGVEMIGLSTENPETSAENVRKFVDDFGVDYTIGWAGPEVAAAMLRKDFSIPQSFIIARDGRILKHFIGFGVINTRETIKQALEDALSNKG